MIEKEWLGQFVRARKDVAEKRPLIHSIMGHIAVNDCANAVLALGASPIMAEHPREVEEITAHAGSLAVSLANINDTRMESMLLSGKTACKKGIPSVIDVVGTACSGLRREYARQYIRECKPAVIKGNLSELKAVAGADCNGLGVDVGAADAVSADQTAAMKSTADLLAAYAKENQAVVLASGAVDIIADAHSVYLVKNGSAHMAQVTGTGCMQNVITAVYLAVAKPVTAALLAAVTLGICGELAQAGNGSGSYHIDLINRLSLLTDEALEQYARIVVL